MLTLGIDTSNYATSLAVVDAARKEVVCAKKRFLPVKQGELGMRQSEALFHHTTALPALLEELRAVVPPALFAAIGAVGVSNAPRKAPGSYMPCFLAGLSFAAAFAAGAGVPVVQASHQQGHLAAARLGAGLPAEGPVLLFHASGGTTELLLADGYEAGAALGGTLDLYAGQAVDRLGVRLGYAFPAGEAVSALAATCGEEVHPKPSLKGMYFHLSGLQNQCERLLEEGKAPAYAAKFCLAGIAAALGGSLLAAQAEYPGLPVVCAGGVMSSGLVRATLENMLDNIHFAPPALSADNAVGVALIAAKEAPRG